MKNACVVTMMKLYNYDIFLFLEACLALDNEQVSKLVVGEKSHLYWVAVEQQMN
jgi:hypothetical protein